ncbi:MAG: beta-propeller domain-containing protein [Acetatifactor sp.]|nr:beta-propeller domain-containing protein [Acetatifactor sp.]
MKNYELLDAVGGIDAEYVEDAARKRKLWHSPLWAKIVFGVACFALILTAAIVTLPGILKEPGDDMPPGSGDDPKVMQAGPDKTPGDLNEGDVGAYGNTSDTYTDLPALLSYLSDHDVHNEGRMDASGGGSVSPAQGESGQLEKAELVESTGVAVDTTGKYSYHIGETSVQISLLDGSNTKNVGSIDVPADGIFTCNDHLLIISQFRSGGDILNEELSVRVSIYDITVPQNPVLQDEYTQLGRLTACWMVGANLYLVTGDGVCACGWSRLDDASGYYPALSHNGEAVEWGDEDISILGEPTRVQYSAITAINGNTCEVVVKEALYGNIKKLFYGEGWIAVTAASETDKTRENPVLYTFDSELCFTGKINAAKILDVPEQNELKDYTAQDGSYLNIVSVSKAGGLYRLLGTDMVRDGEVTASYFMAIAASTETGEADAALLSAENYPYGSFTEVLWESDRAIICVGVMRGTLSAGDDIEMETRVIFAQFDGLQVKLLENQLTAAYLGGRVGVYYGNPLGEFGTLISMGQGIYVRYSNPAEGPGGFDVFDFSDSAAPQLLYRSENSLSGGNAFDYVWYVYDGHTFGTLKVLLGEEDYFRDVSLSWCVFSVDSTKETVITLQREYPLDKEVKTFIGADILGYAVFNVGYDVYYVTRNMASAASL